MYYIFSNYYRIIEFGAFILFITGIAFIFIAFDKAKRNQLNLGSKPKKAIMLLISLVFMLPLIFLLSGRLSSFYIQNRNAAILAENGWPDASLVSISTINFDSDKILNDEKNVGYKNFLEKPEKGIEQFNNKKIDVYTYTIQESGFYSFAADRFLNIYIWRSGFNIVLSYIEFAHSKYKPIYWPLDEGPLKIYEKINLIINNKN